MGAADPSIHSRSPSVSHILSSSPWPSPLLNNSKTKFRCTNFQPNPPPALGTTGLVNHNKQPATQPSPRKVGASNGSELRRAAPSAGWRASILRRAKRTSRLLAVSQSPSSKHLAATSAGAALIGLAAWRRQFGHHWPWLLKFLSAQLRPTDR